MIAAADGAPTMALDASGILRAAMFAPGPNAPLDYCHRPVTMMEDRSHLGDVIAHLQMTPDDDVLDQDLILPWGR